MGVKQVIIDEEDNLSEESFNNLFGVLNSFSEERDLELIITKNNENSEYHYTNGTMLLYLPSLKKEEQVIRLTKNFYLRLLSMAYLKPTNEEVKNYFKKFNIEYKNITRYGFCSITDNHKKNLCVNSIKFYLNESNNSKSKRILKKEGLCFECAERFPEEIYKKYIIGLLR